MLQRWTRQSCDIHQHITKQTALQTMTTHVLEGSALNLSCRLQVDHSYCHPRQTRIHLRVLKTNNNLINKQIMIMRVIMMMMMMMALLRMTDKDILGLKVFTKKKPFNIIFSFFLRLSSQLDNLYSTHVKNIKHTSSKLLALLTG